MKNTLYNTWKVLTITLLLSVFTELRAQQSVIIGAGTQNGTSSNGPTGDPGPMYRSTGTSNFIYSRHHYLYTQAELAAAGIMPGARITMLSWNKDNNAAFNSAAAFEIWIKNSSLTTAPTPPQQWSTLITGATQVYSAPTTLTAAIGFVDFTFNTPFIYTGGALEISVNYDHSAGSSPWSTNGLSWVKDPITDRTISYCGSTSSTSLGNARTVRPQIKISYLPNTAVNNASISEFVAPKNFCPGNQDIKVRLKNTGSNVINNVTIQWELDNIPQSTVYWISPLDTIGGTLYPNDTVITLGNALFTATRTIKAWTEYPNNTADTINYDDTINVTVTPALSGTFTIGGTLPDYATVADAVNALNNAGVCGPVIFNVAPGSGPYTTNLTFGDITGTSATNTIRFNGNGNTVSSANSPVVAFSGSSYIILDSFNIVQTGTTGFGVQINGGSHHLTLNKNTITAPAAATASTAAALAVAATTATAAGNNAQYLTITNNVLENGYYNMTLIGNSSYADNYGHYIANNKFRNAYYYGMNITNGDSIVFTGNEIERSTRPTVSSTTYGIYVSSGRNIKIRKNSIHDMKGSTLYPVYITTSVNSAGYETEVSNNVIYNLGNTGTMYGIYGLSTITGVNLYHNTVQHNHTSGTHRGIFISVAPNNVNVKNNIISITGGGTKHAVYISTTSTSFTSNNNVFHVSGGGTNTIGYWTAARTTLSDWQTASGQDMLSVATDPVFVNLNAGNLKPSSVSVDDIGTPVGITTDILGISRSLVTPDPGAYEVLPASNNNAGVSAIVVPSGFCSGQYDVKARILNAGINVINNVMVNWEVNGITQTPVYWTSPIDTPGSAAGSDTLITLGSYFFMPNTSAVIKVWTSMPNGVQDTLTTNDSLEITVMPSLAGPYTIGSGGSYPSLTAALADVAGSGLCGPVLFELQSNYTSAGETFPLVIPAMASATDSIVIWPQAGATGLSISGSNANAIFDLNGTDYVTIDGRPGGTGISQLSITNTSTSGAVIRLINDATNNRIRYVTITGNNATATSGAVLFSTTTGTAGNSNNLIDNCNINGNSATVNCIYSAGSAAPADNKNNTITNCNIYDFFANVASTDIAGIALMAGNRNWNIGTSGNGNRFYQTAARTATSTPALTNIGLFKAIYINSSTVSGVNITDNRIGGNIPGIPGSTFVIGDASTNVGHTMRLIDNYVSSTSIPNTIQGNIISDITCNSSISNALIPIHARQGYVNTTGNTIGSLTGNGSLMVYFNGTSTGANAYAIRYEAASGLVQDNKIGSISAEVRNASGGLQLLAIYATSTLPTALTISNNTVGGSSPHSIQSTPGSLGNVNVMGICVSGGTGALMTISNNTVTNLSNLNATSGTNNAVKGIYMTGVSSAGSVVSNNTISNLYSVSTNPSADQSSAVLGITSNNSSGSHIVSGNTISGLTGNGASGTTNVSGILISGTTSTTNNLVERNRIFGLTANPLNASTTISGISIGSTVTGRFAIANNMISLGNDSTGAAATGAHAISGISKATTAEAAVLHNSVMISGTGVESTVNNSFAYRSIGNNGVGDSLVNNLFVNTRSNASTGGTHYAVSLANATNLVVNSNLYYTAGPVLGVFNSANQATLADWKAATAQDAASVSGPVNFVSHSDLHLAAGSIGNTLLAGIPLASVPVDYDNAARSSTYPYMGADENSVPVPVRLLAFRASAINSDVHVSWITATEKNTSHFMVEASADGSTFEPVAQVAAKGHSSTATSYSFIHRNAQQQLKNTGVLFYRLVSIDRDGSSSPSEVVRVSFGNAPLLNTAVVYPNPFTSELRMTVPAAAGGELTVTIVNLQGKVVAEFSRLLSEGINELSIDEAEKLSSGIYIMHLKGGNESHTVKLIRQ